MFELYLRANSRFSRTILWAVASSLLSVLSQGSSRASRVSCSSMGELLRGSEGRTGCGEAGVRLRRGAHARDALPARFSLSELSPSEESEELEGLLSGS